MRKTKILRIGVDLDACVVDLDLWVSRLIKRRLKVDIKEIMKKGPVNFYIQEWPEIQKKSGENFVKEIFQRPFVYKNAKPISEAVRVLNRWRKQGHQIWVITARPKEVAGEVTLEWLKNNGLGWTKSRVLFSGYSPSERAHFKSKIAKELNLHIFIEDHAEAVRKIDSDSMILKLVLKYPWNMAEEIGDKGKFVENWQEIDKVVQSVSHNIDRPTQSV